ncbi:MAG: ABC transporter permease [Candidatus Aminicenantes bacterium]|nr:ABC transporter permease [Candidatus Aminicenantes bacterium]
MKRYIVKRILLLLFLLFAVSTMIFFPVHLIPGDPVVKILGEGANSEDVERLRRDLNLHKPLFHQYLDFIRRLLDLSFGKSLFNNREVMANILKYLPNTIYLTIAAMTAAILISLPLGVLAAFKKESLLDAAVTFISSAGLAIPNFFLGPLLVIVFSIKLGWFPVSGCEGSKYIVLPALTLGTSMSAFLTRITRTVVSLELQKPYVLLARAKGLSEFRVFREHVFKNALIPVITTMGLQFGALLTGAVITETIFSWQGIGVLLVESITRRDYPMIQGLIVFITFVYLLVNFLVDLSYFALDPRIRKEVQRGAKL